jgi:hypothetical protein
MFRERMAGPMARGLDNPHVGAEHGRGAGTRLVADFVATIDDLAACITAPDHPARLTGSVSFADLAADAPVTEGTLNLYAADVETRTKQLRYRLTFPGLDGAVYRLEATKLIRPGHATIKEQTTAYARLFAVDRSAVVAAGILVFKLRDLPAFLWSMRVEGGTWTAGVRRFLAFARRELATPVPAQVTSAGAVTAEERVPG